MRRLEAFRKWLSDCRSRALDLLMDLRIIWNKWKGVLVIEVRYGGLGDHLFYSPLPRIAKETKSYKKVFVSDRSSFRDPEIKALVWSANPYVDGFLASKGTYPLIKGVRAGRNLLDEILVRHKILDGLCVHEPEIYYQPNIKEELRGKTVYDPNYSSNAGLWIDSVSVEELLAKRKITVDFQMSLRDNSIRIRKFGQWLAAVSLQDFCDILFSCGRIVCFATGTATLSAALRKPAIVLYQKRIKRMFLHSSLHEYIAVENGIGETLPASIGTHPTNLL